ncbi:MAG: hypothetical protein GY948_22590 [Alphaproteobacteria bacterium]|nr:hypothetical protein [Alphaproteobacteria bacterium]
MFKNAALGTAVAGIVAASALAATATGAQAGKKFYFSVQPPGLELGKGGGADHCRHWRRKWRRTGRQYFLLKYRSCLMHDS